MGKRKGEGADWRDEEGCVCVFVCVCITMVLVPEKIKAQIAIQQRNHEINLNITWNKSQAIKLPQTCG